MCCLPLDDASLSDVEELADEDYDLELDMSSDELLSDDDVLSPLESDPGAV